MLLHYRWSWSEYAVIRFDMWKASMYVLKNIFYIFLFIIIYINFYMFRSYTGMVFFLIKYLRRSVNFLLLKTILATLNKEIQLLKQFSLKHFYQINWCQTQCQCIFGWKLCILKLTQFFKFTYKLYFQCRLIQSYLVSHLTFPFSIHLLPKSNKYNYILSKR